MIRAVLSTLLIAFAFHLCFLSTGYGEVTDDAVNMVNCSLYDSSTDCCNATITNSTCKFVNCTNLNKEVCFSLDSNTTEECGTTVEVNLCDGKHDQTTTEGPTTTPAAIVTSPSTETPTTTPNSTSAPITAATTTPNDTSTTRATATTASPPKAGQHFDGASFIGGIVLCAGIVAIIFFACKFYKARQERNYHTL